MVWGLRLGLVVFVFFFVFIFVFVLVLRKKRGGGLSSCCLCRGLGLVITLKCSHIWVSQPKRQTYTAPFTLLLSPPTTLFSFLCVTNIEEIRRIQEAIEREKAELALLEGTALYDHIFAQKAAMRDAWADSLFVGPCIAHIVQTATVSENAGVMASVWDLSARGWTKDTDLKLDWCAYRGVGCRQ